MNWYANWEKRDLWWLWNRQRTMSILAYSLYRFELNLACTSCIHDLSTKRCLLYWWFTTGMVGNKLDSSRGQASKSADDSCFCTHVVGQACAAHIHSHTHTPISTHTYIHDLHVHIMMCQLQTGIWYARHRHIFQIQYWCILGEILSSPYLYPSDWQYGMALVYGKPNISLCIAASNMLLNVLFKSAG